MREIFVANTDEIEDRERVVIVDGSLEIGVFRLGDDFFAWENNCPHSGGRICQGRIMNRVIENLDENKKSHGFLYVDEDVHIICPWHGFEFNIRTGVHPGDSQAKLNGFDVLVRNGGVYVEIE